MDREITRYMVEAVIAAVLEWLACAPTIFAQRFGDRGSRQRAWSVLQSIRHVWRSLAVCRCHAPPVHVLESEGEVLRRALIQTLTIQHRDVLRLHDAIEGIRPFLEKESDSAAFLTH